MAAKTNSKRKAENRESENGINRQDAKTPRKKSEKRESGNGKEFATEAQRHREAKTETYQFKAEGGKRKSETDF